MIEKTLSELVRFKTLSGDFKENARAFAWIEKQLQGLPLIIRKFSINGYQSLVATTRKTNRPKLLLQAHIDVVGGPDKVFIPKKKFGRLYGRGVFDMKYAAASYIELFRALGQNLKFYDLGLMLTSDEEVGGRNGVGALLEKGLGARLCFLPDGGEDWNVQRSAKGIYQVRIISRGKSGHSSRPWTGANALDQLMTYLTALQKQFVTEPCGQKNHYHPTMTISRIAGGKLINQIPDYAEADVDIRFTPKLTRADLRRRLKANLSKGLEIQELNFANAYEVDMNHPDIVRFLAMLKKRKFKPEFVDSHGSSDARYFLDKKIPTIILRPVGGGHHTDKEWINLSDLEIFSELLRELVEATALVRPEAFDKKAR